MTTYTAWYLTNASILHGQQRNNACDVEAAEVYVYLPVCDSVRSDADAAFCVCVVLMLIHQFITFGFACTPLYFVWEKLIGMHECQSMCKRAVARLPVVIPIWFLAIIFPFFGPINSTVGSLLASFTVNIIPAVAHIFTFRSSAARENSVEQPPRFLGRWTGAFTINAFIVVWVFIVGFGFGGWASMINFVHQIDTFRLFTKCYQCPPPVMASPPPISHPHVNHTHSL
ncbi:BnaAnng28100D [Brassica napus]|uniref:BnaAnng28100D protein n=2 Tax=Brassica napus TaxID=3708 RepID=A0A078JMG8_BRANA|nr:BnaAnng28100D [Brassica napus]